MNKYALSSMIIFQMVLICGCKVVDCCFPPKVERLAPEQFNLPKLIGFDSKNIIYIKDQNGIQKYSENGTFLGYVTLSDTLPSIDMMETGYNYLWVYGDKFYLADGQMISQYELNGTKITSMTLNAPMIRLLDMVTDEAGNYYATAFSVTGEDINYVAKFDDKGNIVWNNEIWGVRIAYGIEIVPSAYLFLEAGKDILFVSAAISNTVAVGLYSLDGSFLKGITTPTIGSCPIALDQDSNIYICYTPFGPNNGAAFEINLICKYNSQGEPIKCWGKLGTGMGQMSAGCYIGIMNGYLYATSTYNQNLQKFDLNGKALWMVRDKLP